ncbi:hypothetical protein TNCV_2901791, partial [Trichonephila clavipes]
WAVAESSDSPTGDSSDEEVLANNLLEFCQILKTMKKLNKTQGAAVFTQKYNISYFRMQ